MNWMGRRNYGRKKNERKIQEEFFARQRQKKKLEQFQPKLPLPKTQGMGMDLFHLKMIDRIWGPKKNVESKESREQRIRRINLDEYASRAKRGYFHSLDREKEAPIVKRLQHGNSAKWKPVSIAQSSSKASLTPAKAASISYLNSPSSFMEATDAELPFKKPRSPLNKFHRKKQTENIFTSDTKSSMQESANVPLFSASDTETPFPRSWKNQNKLIPDREQVLEQQKKVTAPERKKQKKEKNLLDMMGCFEEDPIKEFSWKDKHSDHDRNELFDILDDDVYNNTMSTRDPQRPRIAVVAPEAKAIHLESANQPTFYHQTTEPTGTFHHDHQIFPMLQNSSIEAVIASDVDDMPPYMNDNMEAAFGWQGESSPVFDSNQIGPQTTDDMVRVGAAHTEPTAEDFALEIITDLVTMVPTCVEAYRAMSAHRKCEEGCQTTDSANQEETEQQSDEMKSPIKDLCLSHMQGPAEKKEANVEFEMFKSHSMKLSQFDREINSHGIKLKSISSAPEEPDTVTWSDYFDGDPESHKQQKSSAKGKPSSLNEQNKINLNSSGLHLIGQHKSIQDNQIQTAERKVLTRHPLVAVPASQNISKDIRRPTTVRNQPFPLIDPRQSAARFPDQNVVCRANSKLISWPATRPNKEKTIGNIPSVMQQNKADTIKIKINKPNKKADPIKIKINKPNKKAIPKIKLNENQRFTFRNKKSANSLKGISQHATVSQTVVKFNEMKNNDKPHANVDPHDESEPTANQLTFEVKSILSEMVEKCVEAEIGASQSTRSATDGEIQGITAQTELAITEKAMELPIPGELLRDPRVIAFSEMYKDILQRIQELNRKLPNASTVTNSISRTSEEDCQHHPEQPSNATNNSNTCVLC